jgi:hypothetical protein
VAELPGLVTVGQIPQPYVAADGGQGAPVGGKRDIQYRAGAAGQGLAQLTGLVPVADIPQPDGLVGAGGGQGAPVGGKHHLGHEVGVAGQGLAGVKSYSCTTM